MPQNTNALDELKKHTTIVADTSDFNQIDKYKPQDATTNPSLILKASKIEDYSHLIDEAITFAKKSNGGDLITNILNRIFVNFAKEILKIIPGRVSIEVDARASFDTNKSLEIARHFIDLFKKEKISKDRILIKLASTYECINACEVLEKEGIHCNMTLLFSIEQAAMAAEKKATLISPFVGRILDWYKKEKNISSFKPTEDPGVISVKNIYNYYKKFDYSTSIMGASFRNIDEILELAGCDFLTIAPNLLNELENLKKPIEKKLDKKDFKNLDIKKLNLNENTFRFLLNENAMATEKLAEGIRNFSKDLVLLEELIKQKL
ncbi:MAG: Transaldolase [Candidatus Anoxychlamydiales bacterium]|nr:Transaldolase [Candidatus Anoxychlamydiales bacterium]